MSDTVIHAIPNGGSLPQPPELDRDQIDRAIRRVADDMHRLNNAIVQLVEAGATVELMRCSRHHDRKGNWGDQLQPLVTIHDGAKSSAAVD
jgi:hypothetical protein